MARPTTVPDLSLTEEPADASFVPLIRKAKVSESAVAPAPKREVIVPDAVVPAGAALTIQDLQKDEAFLTEQLIALRNLIDEADDFDERAVHSMVAFDAWMQQQTA